MKKIAIKILSTREELHQMQKVESAVWNMDPIPVHQTFTALNNGGILLGAYDGDHMVGFLYSFAGFTNQVPYLCSHMMGILPAYQTSGLGVKLKQKQAEIANEKGYRIIMWTFDPLESKNAYLNLHKLNAVGALYKTNHYGSMSDDLNQGLPSDRIQIEWDIADSISGSGSFIPLQQNNLLLRGDQAGHPVVQSDFRSLHLASDQAYFISIPNHFQKIKQANFELASEWRFKSRKVFEELYERGFQAVDLLKEDGQDYCYYVLTKKPDKEGVK